MSSPSLRKRSTSALRVALHNTTASDMVRVLDLGTPLQDEVDLYILHPDGRPHRHITAGDRKPFAMRPVQTRVPSAPLHLAPGESVQIYIRLSTSDPQDQP
jgi:diguanylate cyclase